MGQLHFSLSSEFFVDLFKESREDAFAKLMEVILNQVLIAESDEVIGVERYGRGENRSDSRNGYRERTLTLRIGKLTLRVPRHRDTSFKTSMFEDYQRNEQALLCAMMEMVCQGVATRNVQNITGQLCGQTFSKSMVSEICRKISVPVEAFRNRTLSDSYPFVFVDAIYFKERSEGKVTSKAFMVALGINQEGYKEILGFDIYDKESSETWRAFLERLGRRGLSGVDLITSDAHTGLIKAIQETFPDVPWQRCQFHFKKNILDKMKKRDMATVSAKLRDMFDATSLVEARSLRDALIDEYQDVSEDAMKLLDEGFEDAMAVHALPLPYRKFTRTTNVLERENRELRKRQSIIGVFVNVESMLRLMGAVLLDDHEDWKRRSRTCRMEEYYREYEKTKENLKKVRLPFAA